MTGESVAWIVEERVTFVAASGKRWEGRIAIGAPVGRELDCACALLVDALRWQRPADLRRDEAPGARPGVELRGFSLHNFVEPGGRLLQDGEDMAVAVVLGPLYCAPVAPSADGEEADD